MKGVVTVVAQPLGDAVYDITHEPGEIPETVPFEETVAIAVFELDHVPPNVKSLKIEYAPTQIVLIPVIGLIEIGLFM